MTLAGQPQCPPQLLDRIDTKVEYFWSREMYVAKHELDVNKSNLTQNLSWLCGSLSQNVVLAQITDIDHENGCNFWSRAARKIKQRAKCSGDTGLSHESNN